MKSTNLRTLLPAIAAAVILGSGCIAIPMGTETFTTEYPAEIRPTAEPPVVTCNECTLKTVDDDESHLTACFTLSGMFESKQSQELGCGRMVSRIGGISVRSGRGPPSRI